VIWWRDNHFGERVNERRPANGASTDPVITPDGRYVAFISSASNLVPETPTVFPDIFVRIWWPGRTIW